MDIVFDNLIEKSAQALLKLDKVYEEIVFADDKNIQNLKLAIDYAMSLPMSNILIASVSAKAKKFFQTALPNKEDYFVFKKFVRALISLDNEQVLQALETYYISEKNLVPFSIILEELIKANKDVSSATNTFFSLIMDKSESLSTIEKVLSVLGKDLDFAITNMIDNRKFNCLNYFIDLIFLSENSLNTKDNSMVIAKIIIKNREVFERFPNNIYAQTIAQLLNFYPELFPTFLANEQDHILFSNYIINSVDDFKYSINVAKNYSNYLNEEPFLLFEKKLIEKMNRASSLFLFAKKLEKSSKRLILNKLLALSKDSSYNEEYLIDFLKFFPQYKSLLLMI